MRISSEVRYFLSSSFYMDFNKIESFYMGLASLKDIDVDAIADYCEDKKIDFNTYFFEKMDRVYDGLNPFEKSIIYYKFIHNLSFQFEQLVNEITDLFFKIKESDSNFNLNNGIQNNLGYQINTELLYPNSFFPQQGNVFDFITNYLTNLKKTFDKLSKNVYLSFNNVIKMEYSSKRILSKNILNWEIVSNQTNGLVSTPTNALEDLMGIYTDIPKTYNKRTKTVLNKSFRCLSKFVPTKDISRLFSSNGLLIKGKNFNFLFKGERSDILKYSEKLDNHSISYDLELLNKHDEKICNLCVVYKGCPILDEILTNYMYIKTGKEDELISKANTFSKTELYTIYFPEDPIKKKIANIRANEEVSKKYDLKLRIKEWLFPKLIECCGKEPIDYAFNLDVSWEEAIDYNAFNLFDVDVLDYVVKPIKWKEVKNVTFNDVPKLLW